jgi:hypothetical protein
MTLPGYSRLPDPRKNSPIHFRVEQFHFDRKKRERERKREKERKSESDWFVRQEHIQTAIEEQKVRILSSLTLVGSFVRHPLFPHPFCPPLFDSVILLFALFLTNALNAGS